MSNLYFNEESDCYEENTCENEVFHSTALHQRKKLNIFTPLMLIYYIQLQNRKSRLVQMPETTSGGVLWKKVLFKILQNLQETPVPKETPANNPGQLILKFGYCKNEAREIDCLCCREVDAMLIALAKIPEYEGSISPPSFYGHLPNY